LSLSRMSAILGRTLKQVNVGVFCAFPAYFDFF